MNIDDYITKRFANPTVSKDKTQGAQASLDKTVATQTQQKHDPTPEAREENEMAQYANPNAPVSKATEAGIGIGFAGMDQPELKTFYGITGSRAVNLPKALSTEKGVFEFKTEKTSIPEAQQQLIIRDRDQINFGIKKANSGAGLDIDFAVSFGDTQMLVNLMQQQKRLDRLAQFPDNAINIDGLYSVVAQIKELQAAGMTRDDPVMQDLVVNYKTALGLVVMDDVKSIGMDDTEVENASLLEAYNSFLDSSRKLTFARASDGDMLQSRYNSLVSEQGATVTRKVYHDLNTEKDRKFYNTGSRRAKEKLLNNVHWQNAMRVAMETSPVMTEIMGRESEKNYISEYEREIISGLNKQIGPQMREAYDNAVEVLGQAEADMQYRDIKDLFDLYENITYDKVSDDLVEKVFAPASDFILNEALMGTPEEAAYDYDADVASRVEEMSIKKKAQQEAYQKVYGGSAASDASLVSATGSTRKIGRTASRIRT